MTRSTRSSIIDWIVHIAQQLRITPIVSPPDRFIPTHTRGIKAAPETSTQRQSRVDFRSSATWHVCQIHQRNTNTLSPSIQPHISSEAVATRQRFNKVQSRLRRRARQRLLEHLALYAARTKASSVASHGALEGKREGVYRTPNKAANISALASKVSASASLRCPCDLISWRLRGTDLGTALGKLPLVPLAERAD